jgi:hypothetical protein
MLQNAPRDVDKLRQQLTKEKEKQEAIQIVVGQNPPRALPSLGSSGNLVCVVTYYSRAILSLLSRHIEIEKRSSYNNGVL